MPGLKCIYPKCYKTKNGARCMAPNSWIMFLRNNGGQGHSRQEMSQLFLQWKTQNFPLDSTVNDRRIILCNTIANDAPEAAANAAAAQAAAELAAQAAQEALDLQNAQTQNAMRIQRIDQENARLRALQQANVARSAARFNTFILESARRESLYRSKKNAIRRVKQLENARRKSFRKSLRQTAVNTSNRMTAESFRHAAARRADAEAEALRDAQRATKRLISERTKRHEHLADLAQKRLEKASARHASALSRDAASRNIVDTFLEVSRDATRLADSAAVSAAGARQAADILEQGEIPRGSVEEIRSFLRLQERVPQTTRSMEEERKQMISQAGKVESDMFGACRLDERKFKMFYTNLLERYGRERGWSEPGRCVWSGNEDRCDYVMRTMGLRGLRVTDILGSGTQGSVFFASARTGARAVKVSFIQEDNVHDNWQKLDTFWYGVHMHREVQEKLGSLESVKKHVGLPSIMDAKVLYRSKDDIRRNYAGVATMSYKNATPVMDLLNTRRFVDVIRQYGKSIRLLHLSKFAHGDVHVGNVMEANNPGGKTVMIDFDRAVNFRHLPKQSIDKAISYDVNQAILSLRMAYEAKFSNRKEDTHTIWYKWVDTFVEGYTGKKNPSRITMKGFTKQVSILRKPPANAFSDLQQRYDYYFQHVYMPAVRSMKRRMGAHFYEF